MIGSDLLSERSATHGYAHHCRISWLFFIIIIFLQRGFCDFCFFFFLSLFSLSPPVLLYFEYRGSLMGEDQGRQY
ncbi:hypothetical protein M426DRAFT_142519 [Hypoxylon sp. CI-4A]|nr:hypothetical protein M426DRAFT_142519 [Hypoxylon sp. CI-4A]